ncbi:hypothetical protein COP2_027016 [Malus domestica]
MYRLCITCERAWRQDVCNLESWSNPKSLYTEKLVRFIPRSKKCKYKLGLVHMAEGRHVNSDHMKKKKWNGKRNST